MNDNFERDLSAVRASLKYPDDSGLEHVDDRPVEVPLGLRRPLTLQEQIRQYLRQEVGLARLGVDSSETFEDSLDLGDDGDEPLTPAESRAAAEEELLRSAREATEARSRARAIRSLKARGGPPKAGDAGPGVAPKAQEGAAPPAKPGSADSTPT